MKDRRIVYNLCCKSGKVFVEPFKKPPPFLEELLNFAGPSRSKQFIEKIRQYNYLFAFTSMGATIDRSVNDGGGPNIFNQAICPSALPSSVRWLLNSVGRLRVLPATVGCSNFFPHLSCWLLGLRLVGPNTCGAALYGALNCWVQIPAELPSAVHVLRRWVDSG